MAATAGYQAGIASDDVELSYAPEATWGVLPAVAFKALRITSETLAGQKARQRPAEISRAGQAAAAVTTQVTAGGQINFALSSATFDDVLASLLRNDWATDELTNGTLFKSLHIQKRLAADKYLRYPGSYVTAGSLTASVGQFLSGSFTVASKSQDKATADASTGAFVAAPGGRVVDGVSGVRNLMRGGAAVQAVVESVTLNITNEGAAGQYGLGSASAQGMTPGTFTLAGQLRTFFKDFTLYDEFAAETLAPLSFETVDLDGDGYRFTVLAATLMNPQIVAGGPGQAVMAEFAIEGNPSADGGPTLQVERITAP
jgi:hypothetical protein